jgi:hypothetical protein
MRHRVGALPLPLPGARGDLVKTFLHVCAILGGLACMYAGFAAALVGLIKAEAWLQRRNREREDA